MAITNELNVRLITCSHTLQEWANLSKPVLASPTIPFLGEVCLESYEILDKTVASFTNGPSWESLGYNNGDVVFRVKIGDAVHDYLELPYHKENWLTNDMVKQIVLMMDVANRATLTIQNNGTTLNTYVPYDVYNSALINNSATINFDATNYLNLSVNNGIIAVGFKDNIEHTNSTHSKQLYSDKIYVWNSTANNWDEVIGKNAVTTLINSLQPTWAAYNKTASGIFEVISGVHQGTNGAVTADTKTIGSITAGIAIDTSTDKIVTSNAVKEFVETKVDELEDSITGGTKINIDNTDGVVINHDLTTRTDNTDIQKNFEAYVVTDVTTDTTGHVTSVVTSKLPANPVGPNTVDNIIVGNGDNTVKDSGKSITSTKPSSTSTDNTIPTSKAVNDAIDSKITDSINSLDSYVSADTNNVLTGITETDGKLTGKTQVAYTDIAPVQNVTTTDTGNSGLEVTTSNNTKDVHHKAVAQNNTDNSSVIGEKELTVVTGVNVDSYGHMTGITTDFSTNLIAADIKAPVIVSDNSMWNNRITGGTININEDTVKINPLKGNTVVWNQQILDCETKPESYGITRTKVNSYTVHYSGTSTNSVSYTGPVNGEFIITHLYYIAANGCPSSCALSGAGARSIGVCKKIIKPTMTARSIGVYIPVNTTINDDISFVCIDLTQMFGIGNEPSTVEEFEAMFPEDYYEYNAGELVSLNPTALKTTDSNNNIIGTLDLSWIKDIKYNGSILFPNGLCRVGDVYDEVGEDYAVKRIGSRVYNASTDDDNPAILTNKITTYYVLEEPITVYFSKKNLNYPVKDDGKEILLPENTESTIYTAPFNGTFQYKNNFKDAVLDLIDTVNNYKNPVRGVGNTNQNTGEIAVYDSDSTVYSSGYKASNRTIVTTDSDNNVTLPTIESIVNYVQTSQTQALRYKGTVSSYNSLPSSGTSTGDLYILTAEDGSYNIGDFFIRNVDNDGWDVIQGTVKVTNNNPTLLLDGTIQTVGTVEGVNLQITNPNLNVSDPTVSGSATNLEVITNVSQNNGKLNATKKTIPYASTTQTGVTQYVTDIHNSTDETKTATAKQIWDECEKRNVQFVEMESIETLIHSMSETEFISNYAYGAKWTQNSDNVTYVGAPDLKLTLPVHNALRACVYRIVPVTGGFDVTETVDDVKYSIHYGARREFLYWLDEDDWSLKSDGTPAVLTGEDMTGIAIWHPKFYCKSFDGVTVGNAVVNEVCVSMLQYDETWIEIKEGYIDFAKMQSVATNGVTYARCFGNPDFTVTNPMEEELTLTALGTWIEKQKGSDIALAKSQISLNRVTAHQYALNSGAHLMSYEEYKWIFCWLPVIELATEDKRAAFYVENNSVFDWADGANTNIVTRASLQNIPAFMYYGLYSANYQAIINATGWNFVPAGYSNVLGTHTGWVKMRLPNSGGTYDSKIISRWRGFEIQRNIWTNLMGVNPVQTNVEGSCDIYTTKNRALWDNDMPINITDSSSVTHDNIVPWTHRNSETPEYETKTGWSYAGTQAWSGFGKEFDLGSKGEVFYKATGSTKPDYSYGTLSVPNPRCFIAGGYAISSSNGGLFCFYSHGSAGYAIVGVGFRCCWNVDEYESILN